VFKTSNRFFGPIQPPIQWVLTDPSLCLNRQRCEVNSNHSAPYSAEVKINGVTSVPPLRALMEYRVNWRLLPSLFSFISMKSDSCSTDQAILCFCKNTDSVNIFTETQLRNVTGCFSKNHFSPSRRLRLGLSNSSSQNGHFSDGSLLETGGVRE
jgi:hypothetical protein